MSKATIRRLLHKLSEAQRLEEKEILSARFGEYKAAEQEKKALTDQLSKRMKRLRTEMDEAKEAADTGLAWRDTECEWGPGPGGSTVLRRKDTGEIIETKWDNGPPMDERQPNLPFDEAAEAAATAQAAAMAAAQGAAAPANDGASETPLEGWLRTGAPAEPPAESAEAVGMLMSPLATRVLGSMQQMTADQAGRGESEWISLAAIRPLFPEADLRDLREAGEQLVERGALDARTGSPGTWRVRARRDQELDAEEKLDRAQDIADDLSVCEALETLEQASAAGIGVHLNMLSTDVEGIVRRLVGAGLVQVVKQGSTKKPTVYGVLSRLERVTRALQRSAGDMQAELIAEEAAVPQDEVAGLLGTLILKGLVASEGPQDGQDWYRWRRETPSAGEQAATKSKARGKHKAAAAQ